MHKHNMNQLSLQPPPCGQKKMYLLYNLAIHFLTPQGYDQTSIHQVLSEGIHGIADMRSVHKN